MKNNFTSEEEARIKANIKSAIKAIKRLTTGNLVHQQNTVLYNLWNLSDKLGIVITEEEI